MPVDPAGTEGPTRAQAAGRYWRRTSPGLYVPVDVDDDIVEQRILEQSMRLPPASAVTGWAACRLHGANFCDGLDRDGRTRLPVPLLLGPRGHLARNPEFRPVFRPLPDVDRDLRYGIDTVTIARATYDAVWLAVDATEAIVAIDVMCAAELVSLRQLHAYADRQRFRRRKFDAALARATEHSRSPNETRLRDRAERIPGFPRLLVNYSILDLHGRLLGVADLLDPVAGLAIEFHGAEHRGAVRQTADVVKEEAMRAVGLEVTAVTGRELHQPHTIENRLRAARARALFEPESVRRWIARPPRSDLHERLVARSIREEAWEARNRRSDSSA